MKNFQCLASRATMHDKTVCYTIRYISSLWFNFGLIFGLIFSNDNVLAIHGHWGSMIIIIIIKL